MSDSTRERDEWDRLLTIPIALILTLELVKVMIYLV